MSTEHDINCGIDSLRLGQDIGCTCAARFSDPEPRTAAARLLEWADGMYDGSGCVYCQFSEGHDSDCLVDAAIAEAAEYEKALLPSKEGSPDE